MVDFNSLFSTNAHGMKRSEIRELLKIINRPEVISFAGGLPAAKLFPVQEIREVTDYILETEGRKALQYGSTEGDGRLIKLVIEHMAKDGGIKATADNIIVVTASQQSLDLVPKILLNPNDIVLVEEPSYVGALQAIVSYGAQAVPVAIDKDGLKMDQLEKTIQDIHKRGDGGRLKMVYTIPDFQNPSGITMSLERRKALVELAEKYNFLILEDTPYRQLRYTGESVAPIYALDSYGRTISLFTFSKIFCPGFRLGWVVAPKPIIEKLVIAKQATDLCTAPFTQAITYEFLKRGYLDQQIKKIVVDYREQRDFMLAALEREMPKMEGLTWTKPDGGLFLWVTLPERINTRDLVHRAIENNVAYVVGDAFHPQGECKNSMRLNFSYPTKEQIDKGIKSLANVVKIYDENLRKGKVSTTVTP